MFKKSHTRLTRQIAINKGAIYHAQINLASIEERLQFNKAIENGANVYLRTQIGEYKTGEYKVRYIDKDWQYHTEGTCVKDLCGKIFEGCNDEVWADLLMQAKVERHKIFNVSGDL